MKNFAWTVAILLVSCAIFCFLGCEQDTPISDENLDTSSLTLDFNGGKYLGNSSMKFTDTEVEDFAGLPINNALEELGVDIDRLHKDNYEFVGWTLKRNGQNLVRYLPEYGVLYAKWNNGTGGGIGDNTVIAPGGDSSSDDQDNDPNAPLSITLDFNGGTMNGESSITLTYEDLELFIGMPYMSAINTLGVLTSVPTKNDGSIFVGFATTKNGTVEEPWVIPESGSYTLYAIYMQM